MRRQPAWVDVVLRTAVYTLGVAVVLILEKGFENQREEGGFGPALQHLFQQEDIYHLWATTLCVSGALLGYNVLSALRRHLGQGGLIRIFLMTHPEETTTKQSHLASEDRKKESHKMR